MRADTGAISGVQADDGRLECRVIGGGPARGICGSGLVDAVACALDLGLILPDGKFAGASALSLRPPVSLSQPDIRELQLAKGAIAAGIRILLRQLGAEPSDVRTVWLAGAFGNYLNRASARRIGLVDFPADRVVPAGNTALLGAKIALFDHDGVDGPIGAIRARTRHVGLSDDPEFLDTFVDSMAFPPPERAADAP
jgi:uncharacterized 2Fe-2S/4Fe-4S cluster protein (DUF4445 family)